MRIELILAVFTSVLCGAAAAGPATLTGSWSGEMRQIETSAETSYPMTLTIKGKTAEANYPSLNCSGTWTKVAEKNGYVIYAEAVTNQKDASCIDGIVMVTLDMGRAFVGWYAANEGEPIVATAVLEKSAAK